MALRDRYQFTRRQSRCAVTERPFEDGQQIHTAIFIGLTDQGYLRKDYSADGWEQRPDEDRAPYSSWTSKWQRPTKEPSERPLRPDSAEALLSQFQAEDLPETEGTRYILALMLERARVITEEDTTPLPDGLLRIYMHKKTGERYIIKDPQLTLDAIMNLQSSVIALLDGQ